MEVPIGIIRAVRSGESWTTREYGGPVVDEQFQTGAQSICRCTAVIVNKMYISFFFNGQSRAPELFGILFSLYLTRRTWI